jgi:hypothetical protein
MKRAFIVLMLGLAFMLAAGAAFAAEKGMDSKAPPVSFDQIDKDGNGMVTWKEVIAVYPSVTKKKFAAWDTNKNGSLDQAEWDAVPKDQLGRTESQAKHQRKQGNPKDKNF